LLLLLEFEPGVSGRGDDGSVSVVAAVAAAVDVVDEALVLVLVLVLAVETEGTVATLGRRGNPRRARGSIRRSCAKKNVCRSVYDQKDEEKSRRLTWS
jgi:hypothetical protein